MIEEDVEIITDKLLIHIEMTCREDIDLLLESNWVGCYNCIAIFDSKSVRIITFKHRPFAPQTRRFFCPRCRTDTLIGDFVRYPVTASLLKELNSLIRPNWLRNIYPWRSHNRSIRKRIIFQNPPFTNLYHRMKR